MRSWNNQYFNLISRNLRDSVSINKILISYFNNKSLQNHFLNGINIQSFQNQKYLIYVIHKYSLSIPCILSKNR
jgi:hypothetical protein